MEQALRKMADERLDHGKERQLNVKWPERDLVTSALGNLGKQSV